MKNLPRKNMNLNDYVWAGILINKISVLAKIGESNIIHY